MKDKELARFEYEGYEYLIQHKIYHYDEFKVSYPSIAVTTKSSNKKRGKFSMKWDAHNKLTNLKNPYPLIRKILKIFEEGFKDCQYVCFTAYEEKEEKRQKVYEYYLNKIGFKTLYSGGGYYFLGREGFEIKKKEINSVLWGIYGELEGVYEYVD
jgi:hypothetical protein